MGLLFPTKLKHFILVLIIFDTNVKFARLDPFVDEIVPSFKISTEQYPFLVQLFRRMTEQDEWRNIGQASLITPTKAFTAALALYYDRVKLVGYSNIGCYGTAKEDQYVGKYTNNTAGPPFHATRIMVAGGRTGLGMITFEEKISNVKKPVPVRRMGFTEFEPCISLAWSKRGMTAELTLARYTLLPREMCSNKFHKPFYHFCGRSDSRPENYLGDGDLGAALLCAGRLTGVGLPIRSGKQPYVKKVATFISIVYFYGKFNVEDDKGHKIGFGTHWSLTFGVLIFWKYLNRAH